jgi:hypothetical protein
MIRYSDDEAVNARFLALIEHFGPSPYEPGTCTLVEVVEQIGAEFGELAMGTIRVTFH